MANTRTPPRTRGGTVDIPLLGRQPKGVAIGGGIVLVGSVAYGLYSYEKKKKASATAAAASAATAQQTAAAAQAQYAYGYGTGYYGYGEPTAYYGYGASGGFDAGYYGYGVVEPTTTANTTNAQWAQAAVNQLTSEGYDATTVSAALGAFLAGSSLTSAQVPIVQAAIAIEGYPPQGPDTINQQGTTGGGTGGGQTTGTGSQAPPTGLSASGNTLSWQAASGATSYFVEVWNLSSGQTVFSGQTSGNSITVPGLQSGITYDWYVQANGPSGVSSVVNGTAFSG
jgi:hypothetical protein